MKMMLVSGLLLAICGNTAAQDIRVRAFDGNSGRPLANQRLLIFMFDGLNTTRTSTDIHTDSLGEGVLRAERLKGRYIQIWTDFMTDCVYGPNESKLEVAAIHTSGIVRTNACSSKVAVSAGQHQVVVFARKPTFAEKMAW